MFYACCEEERTYARGFGPDSRDGRPQGCNPIGPTTIEGPKIGTIRKSLATRRPSVPDSLKSKTLNGAEGDRTLNLRIANAALSQLSYRPNRIRN